MLKNYIIIAYRNLWRNKSYTFISSFGLALGVACALLLFLLIDFHLSFDQYHTKADRIYRINTDAYRQDGTISYSPGTPFPMAEALRNDFASLEGVAPIFYTAGQLSIHAPKEVRKFQEDGIVFTTEDYTQTFDVEWLQGDIDNALAEPNGVVLTQKLAVKYFGALSPLGEIITLDNKIPLEVTGVIGDPPAQSSVPYQMLVSYHTLGEYMSQFALKKEDMQEWGSINSNSQVYLLLPAGMNVQEIEAGLPAFNEKYKSGRTLEEEKNSLQPLKQVHGDERYADFANKFSKAEAWSLSIVGIFLVLIACVNFVNLATVQALKRSREVGIRKVLGGRRTQLISQFLGETALIVLLSLMLSLALVQTLLPYFNQFIDLELTMSYAPGGSLLFFLLTIFVVIALVAGVYPAILLSGFEPAKVLKSNSGTIKMGGLSVRRCLVGLQFIIAQVLIVATLVVLYQHQFLSKAAMGFNKEAIINVPIPDNTKAKLAAFRALVSQQIAVEAISYSFEAPASNSSRFSSFMYDTLPETAPFSVQVIHADANYEATYGLELVAGRMIQESDTAREIVVNETFLRKIGLNDPRDIIGKTVSLGAKGNPKPIVGIIKDFHQGSLRGTIAPLALVSGNMDYYVAGIKLVGPHVFDQGLAGIEKAWTTVFPEYVYDYTFLDASIASFYEGEKRAGQLLTVFSIIAIFIGCLGLYGLVTFHVNQRLKEVCIRKVLGASGKNIMWLFSKEFTALVLVAFAIAAPLAAFIMYHWLQNFAYRIALNPLYFIVSLLLMLAIASLTVGLKSRAAILSNPVDTLRSE